MLAASQARIDPADRGFLLGDGVFETMRVAGAGLPLCPPHGPAGPGAAVLHMPPPDMAVLSAGVDALLGACALVSGSLRLTLTRGTGPRGLLPPAPVVPTCLITATAGMPPSTPVRLVTSTHRRDAAGVLSRIKSLNYLPSILARMEAAAQGADDALLLNHAGHVAETSASTLVACMGAACHPRSAMARCPVRCGACWWMRAWSGSGASKPPGCMKRRPFCPEQPWRA
ncbi:aminotransferase class IV [Komagataeibacter rhaeticus]|nr:aminotransferase class IV [Komagataeibacter rhaeticus]